MLPLVDHKIPTVGIIWGSVGMSELANNSDTWGCVAPSKEGGKNPACRHEREKRTCRNVGASG